MSADGAFDAGPAARGQVRVAGVVLLSMLSPGLGQIRLGLWQAGLIVLGIAELLLIGLRAVPHLMAPTLKALLLEAGLGFGLLGLMVCAAIHAAWVARRKDIELETMGRSTATYVPMPLDIRVQQTGPDLSFAQDPPRRAAPWLTAACLIAAGAAAAVLLPAQWGTVTVATIGMGPTLSVGDRLLVDLHRTGLLPRRGDVVVFRSREADRPFILRRVIALPGDRVVVRRRTLMLNGNRLSRTPTSATFEVDGFERPVMLEAYPFMEPLRILPDVDTVVDDEARLIVVPPGQVFVMRDDRASPVATAGSVAGVAPVSDVESVATMIVWGRNGTMLPRRL